MVTYFILNASQITNYKNVQCRRKMHCKSKQALQCIYLLFSSEIFEGAIQPSQPPEQNDRGGFQLKSCCLYMSCSGSGVIRGGGVIAPKGLLRGGGSISRGGGGRGDISTILPWLDKKSREEERSKKSAPKISWFLIFTKNILRFIWKNSILQ